MGLGTERQGSYLPLQSENHRLLVNLAGGVFQNDVGEHCRIGLIRQVRAEADADIEVPERLQILHSLSLLQAKLARRVQFPGLHH
jgi:hypothetical protein